MIEIWKDIPDFEQYQVSDLGRVRRHPDKQHYHKSSQDKVLKNYLDKERGYLSVDLCINNKRTRKTIHQLVAKAFIDGFEYGDIINHIDGDKTNNAVVNLEKCDYRHNNLHAYATGLNPFKGKSKYYNVSTRVRKNKSKEATVRYVASVKVNSKRIFLGWFADEIEAAKAVDAYWDSIGDTIHRRNFPNP